MTKLVLMPTDTAQWLALVHEAEHSMQLNLKEDLESYLVFLLMRFTMHTQLASQIVGFEFLQNLNSLQNQRPHHLREVGDTCLVLSGLFPGRAQKRRVKLSYYIQIGQSAYSTLSLVEERGSAKLFGELATYFVTLRDILHSIRQLASEHAGADIWQNLEGVSKKKSLFNQEALPNSDLDMAPLIQRSSQSNH